MALEIRVSIVHNVFLPYSLLSGPKHVFTNCSQHLNLTQELAGTSCNS